MEEGTLKEETGTLKVHCHDKQGPHDKSHKLGWELPGIARRSLSCLSLARPGQAIFM